MPTTPPYVPVQRPTSGKASDFWTGLSTNNQYSEQQRQHARKQARAEQGFAGTEREGITYRRGLDEFNAFQQSPPAAGGGGAGALPPSPPPASPRVAPPLQQVVPAGPQQTPPATPAPQIPIGRTTPGTIGQVNPTTAPGGPKPTIAPGRQTDQDMMLREAIMGLLKQNPNDVSLTDADVAPQARAFEAQQNRAALMKRAEVLERAQGAGTLSSGGTDAELAGVMDEQGQTVGAFNADLLSKKQQSRREQLLAGIQIAQQMGRDDQANDLQRQLANLDAQVRTRGQDIDVGGQQLQRDLANLDTSSKVYLADLDAQLRREGYSTQERLAQLDAELRRMGLQTQGDMGRLEIALRDKLGVGQLNLGWLQTLMQGQQFNDKLGFDIGQFAALLNQSAVLGR